jgi:WD40 repeat protein/DNA-binding winged helix-turn-helix (wHTH) protein
MATTGERFVRFGPFRLNPRSGELFREGRPVRLPPQASKLLLLLTSTPGELVSREEIQKALWRDDTFVDFEHGINKCINQVRAALGDGAEEPVYVQTVSRRGYRFLGTVEVEGSERAEREESPYPGLSTFTEKDAAFFFGREGEVEALWSKIERRRLLGLIGPSGAGKSSFLNAGLLPSRPEGWRVVMSTPGTSPMSALTRAMLSETSNAEPTAHTLVVVDAFEELFTLNPPEVQREFAQMVGRLAAEENVHVLVSMRDDFLFRCHEHESLKEVFFDLTPIGAPTGEALRRALVQPALDCGYGFESEELVEEMLSEVEKERGALPLLAFAAARLWEKRDRERKILTREAYEENGRVGGALARHAEATLEGIGASREPLVRELFRNLVTAQGTRASREVSELLSVFPEQERGTAEAVLRELVTARLLTSYETSVEIIHESLLNAWPRLVRWRTQDVDGALLRDQLRQAAHAWQDRGRPDDLLWTGKSYRELSLWRESYGGALSKTERAFAEAVTMLAERKSRRQLAAVGTLVAAASLVVVVTSLLWRRSEEQTRRARAASLVELARGQLDEDNTIALAYATASLELADRPETRRRALEALWRGPTFFSIPGASPYGVDFSADGRWLAAGGALWPASGGSAVPLKESGGNSMEIAIGPRGDVVVSQMDPERFTLGIWSIPEGNLLRKLHFEGLTLFLFSGDGKGLITATDRITTEPLMETVIRSWPLAGGEPDILATVKRARESANAPAAGIDPTSRWLFWADGPFLRLATLRKGVRDPEPIASLEHASSVSSAAFDATGNLLATADVEGNVRLWSMDRDLSELVRVRAPGRNPILSFDAAGTRLVVNEGLVDVAAPPEYEPLRLHRSGGGWGAKFEPSGGWIATGGSPPKLWPLSHSFPKIIRGHEDVVCALAFVPDGSFLVSASGDGTIRSWPLPDGPARSARLLLDKKVQLGWAALAIDPESRFLVAANFLGEVVVVPFTGSPPRSLAGFSDVVDSVAIDPTGRFVAAGSGGYYKTQAVVRVWDLETEEVRILDAGDGQEVLWLEFTSTGELLVSSGETQRLWSLENQTFRVLPTRTFAGAFLLQPDGEQVLLKSRGALRVAPLFGEGSRPLETHGSRVRSMTFDHTGEFLVSGDLEGAIRVGSVDGGEPQILFGHDGPVTALAVSPDNHWIASGGHDGTIRLWPMPDLSKPPLQTLPYRKLLAKLHEQTNLRAVPDPGSATGYKLEVGAFRGWKHVPEW